MVNKRHLQSRKFSFGALSLHNFPCLQACKIFLGEEGYWFTAGFCQFASMPKSMLRPLLIHLQRTRAECIEQKQGAGECQWSAYCFHVDIYSSQRFSVLAFVVRVKSSPLRLQISSYSTVSCSQSYPYTKFFWHKMNFAVRQWWAKAKMECGGWKYFLL